MSSLKKKYDGVLQHSDSRHGADSNANSNKGIQKYFLACENPRISYENNRTPLEAEEEK